MKCFEFTRYLDFSITVLDKMRNVKKKLRKFAFEIYGANLSIADLHDDVMRALHSGSCSQTLGSSNYGGKRSVRRCQ